MTIFICDSCGLEMDYDEDIDEIIDCEGCGTGFMYGTEI